MYQGKTLQKVPFFEDSEHCPKILDYIVLTSLCKSVVNWQELQLLLLLPVLFVSHSG